MGAPKEHTRVGFKVVIFMESKGCHLIFVGLGDGKRSCSALRLSPQGSNLALSAMTGGFVLLIHSTGKMPHSDSHSMEVFSRKKP